MLNNKVCYLGNDKLIVKDNNVYIGDKQLRLLGSGVDGYVYKYKGKAIKLYHDNFYVKDHLTKEQINILCYLFTKNIVLPMEFITSIENNPGFAMEYINLENNQDILNIKLDILINELKKIEIELLELGKNHFLLNDKLTNNLYFSDKLYLLDPDSFLYDEKVDFSYKNIEIFNWNFIRDIIFKLDNDLSKKDQISLVRRLNYYYKKSNCLFLSDFLDMFLDENKLNEIRENFIKKQVKILNK